MGDPDQLAGGAEGADDLGRRRQQRHDPHGHLSKQDRTPGHATTPPRVPLASYRRRLASARQGGGTGRALLDKAGRLPILIQHGKGLGLDPTDRASSQLLPMSIPLQTGLFSARSTVAGGGRGAGASLSGRPRPHHDGEEPGPSPARPHAARLSRREPGRLRHVEWESPRRSLAALPVWANATPTLLVIHDGGCVEAGVR
jgi:hypothetical protein